MAARKEFSQAYAALCARYNLPTFKTLNADFDLDTIEQTKHPLTEASKKIFERLDGFRKVLESLEQPDTSIINMQEAEMLTEEQHERIAAVLRRLMRLDRQLLLAELENQEELYAGFVKEASREWGSIRQELAPLIARLRQEWSKGKAARQHQHYVG